MFEFKNKLIIVLNPFYNCVNDSLESKKCFDDIVDYCNSFDKDSAEIVELFCETNDNYRYMKTNKYHNKSLFTGKKMDIKNSVFAYPSELSVDYDVNHCLNKSFDRLTENDIVNCVFDNKECIKTNRLHQPMYDEIDIMGYYADTNVLSTAVCLASKYPYMKINVLLDYCVFTDFNLFDSVVNVLQNIGVRVYYKGVRCSYKFNPFDCYSDKEEATINEASIGVNKLSFDF